MLLIVIGRNSIMKMKEWTSCTQFYYCSPKTKKFLQSVNSSMRYKRFMISINKIFIIKL